MKFKAEHYDELKTAIDSISDKHPSLEKYKENSHSERRYRWDLLWASKYKIPFNEYEDAHIDTALRAITNTK